MDPCPGRRRKLGTCQLWILKEAEITDILKKNLSLAYKKDTY